MTRQLVNILIVVLILVDVMVNAWNIHLIASVSGVPYASTQEFISFAGIVWAGILGLVLYGINRRG